MSTDESDGIDAIEAAFSAGDEGAPKGAYEACGSLVYTFCRRLVGKAQAEGVTKDVFVGAWQDRARFDSDVMSLAGWLMAIARSRIRDNMRLHGRLSEDTGAEAIRIGDRTLLATEQLRQYPSESSVPGGPLMLKPLTGKLKLRSPAATDTIAVTRCRSPAATLSRRSLPARRTHASHDTDTGDDRNAPQ